MKTYVIDLHTYDTHARPAGYDYTSAVLIRAEIDELNEKLRYHAAELNETPAGTLILSAERNETPARYAGVAWIESRYAAREIERIADEYGFFEVPPRFALADPELNKLIALA